MRPDSRATRPLLLIAVLTLFHPGCGGEEELPGLGLTGGGKADSLMEGTTFSLYFKTASAGAITVRDYPYFGESYAPRLACDKPVTRKGMTRSECQRQEESLEVLFFAEKEQALAIYRPEGRTSEKRYFATCAGANASTPLPASLLCTIVKAAHDPSTYNSPIPPSADGVTVPNAHWVGASGLILRGMELKSQQGYDELVTAGVEADLIFKKLTGYGPSLADEQQAFAARGLDPERVINVPIYWKDFPDFRTPCRQTLDGLRFLRAQTEAGRPVFFHCTVGEDRTGFLAGVVRLLEGETDLAEVFADELCDRGFSSGNPYKPPEVTDKVDTAMTPLLLKMAYKIAAGELSSEALDSSEIYSICEEDPASDPGFAVPRYDPAAYRCGTSRLLAAGMLAP